MTISQTPWQFDISKNHVPLFHHYHTDYKQHLSHQFYEACAWQPNLAGSEATSTKINVIHRCSGTSATNIPQGPHPPLFVQTSNNVRGVPHHIIKILDHINVEGLPISPSPVPLKWSWPMQRELHKDTLMWQRPSKTKLSGLWTSELLSPDKSTPGISLLMLLIHCIFVVPWESLLLYNHI